MPPRKTTAAGPSKRRRGDPGQIFFNDNAEAIYNTHLASKEGIRERGFDTTITSILQNIEQRQWQTFTAQPDPAVLPLVREFYANARIQITANPEVRRVLVRGRLVAFDHATINQELGVEDIEEDDYSAFVEQDPDFDGIIRRLCVRGSSWRKTGDQFVNFPRRMLDADGKGWHYFISARLLPSNHVSDVTKERAILNYAISTRMSINVGKIIESSIIAFATGRLTASLGHPSLITQLCELAGVVSRPDEERQTPLPIINNLVMEKLEKTVVETVPRPPTSRASAAQRSGSQSSAQSGISNDELHAQMKGLKLEQTKTRKTLRRHSKQMDYMVDVCKALVTAYQSGSTPSQGSSSMFFPAPPSLSPYQTESDAEESDSAEESE